MFDRIKEYVEEKERSKDYSKGFFSGKMLMRIILVFVAVGFLFIAKSYDAKQAEKQAALDAAIENAENINKYDAGVAPGAAPDFKIKTFSEKDDTLSAHFGRPIVLAFWATWSDESQQTLPMLDDAYDKYSDSVDFMLVNLTDGKQDSVKTVKKFLSAAKYGFPVYFDTEHEAELAYNVLAIPLTVFIDREGNVTSCVLDGMSAEVLDGYISEICK